MVAPADVGRRGDAPEGHGGVLGPLASRRVEVWGPSIRSDRKVIEPSPDQAGNPIHERDIADVIIADLLDPGRRGRIDTIIGPGTLTKREQVAAIADDITLDEVTPEQARDFYRRQGGFAAENADWLLGFASYDGAEGSTDEPHETNADPDSSYLTLDQVLGRPARTYDQWARDHACDFTGSPDQTRRYRRGPPPRPAKSSPTPLPAPPRRAALSATKGYMTTVRGYTNDQDLLDCAVQGPARPLRRREPHPASISSRSVSRTTGSMRCSQLGRRPR
ncbi:hypothetical protein OHR68_19550 [Spirillospora sp. NBC_00431]